MDAFPSVHEKEKSLDDKGKKREKEKEGVSERSNLASPKQNQKRESKKDKNKDAILFLECLDLGRSSLIRNAV
jgi:hypothetical protein